MTEFAASAKEIRSRQTRCITQDLFKEWLANKAGPAIGTAGVVVGGTRRFEGQVEVPEYVPDPLKFGARRAKGVAGELVPLAYRDLAEAFKADWKSGVGVGLLEFIGVGANVYESRTSRGSVQPPKIGGGVSESVKPPKIGA